MTRRVALVVAGLLLAAGLLELALRISPVPAIETHRRRSAQLTAASFFEYDPDLGWRGRPRATGRFAGFEFTSHVQLNARGFRDRDVPDAKPADRFRILLLGDSITWGHGVGQDERFSDHLERRLRAGGVAVDVVNLGIGGYGTDQELLLYRREGRALCPDLTVLGLYENDLRENASDHQGRYPKPYFLPASNGVLTLANVPVPRAGSWLDEPERARTRRSGVREELRLYAAAAFVRETVRRAWSGPPRPPEVPDGAVTLTARLIDTLRREVEAGGSRFAVIALPDLHAAPAVGDAARRSGTPMWLDLGPAFAGASEPLFYRLDGAHWTPRAHALAGDRIAEFVVTTKALPERPRRCDG